jgi:rod shape-determining protein MreC
MELLVTRFRNLTVLLLVILAQLVLLAYQVKSNQDVRLIRVWAVTAVTPLARVLEFVREHTIGVAENYFVLVNVRNENQRLTEEVGKLKMENQFLRSELQTADRAQALQAFQARTPSRTLPSRIIGTGTGANSRVVFTDRGSSDGVMRGMAVVTPDGIVGKVLASYPTAAQVLLVTDSSFAAGVISDKNRVHGTLKGIGQSKCIVDYVQNEEKVEVGEMFYTSGDDRIFPKGMPAGKVSVVRQGKNYKEIYIVPSGFQHGLEEVLVVLEGVHQPIPQSEAPVTSDLYVAPAPEQPKPAQPAASEQQSAAPATAVPESMMTDADKLRQRYKRIGEAQGHTYGEGIPGSRPPDFNANPDAAPARPPVPKPAAPSTSTTQPNATPSGSAVQPPAVQRPSTPTNATPSGSPVQPPAVQRPATQPNVPPSSGTTQRPATQPPGQSNTTPPTVQRPTTQPNAAPSSGTAKPPAEGSSSAPPPPAAKPKPQPPANQPQ